MDNFDLRKYLVENKLTKSSQLNEENLEEGFKEWLLGGLLAVSSIAGFYKLSDKAKKDRKAKTEYIQTLNKVIDKLDSTKTVNLANEYNKTDFGTGSSSAGHIESQVGYKKDGNFTATNPDTEQVKNNIKREIQNHPENFQISKDGTTIKPAKP